MVGELFLVSIKYSEKGFELLLSINTWDLIFICDAQLQETHGNILNNLLSTSVEYLAKSD